jgi:hypothetical protein
VDGAIRNRASGLPASIPLTPPPLCAQLINIENKQRHFTVVVKKYELKNRRGLDWRSMLVVLIDWAKLVCTAGLLLNLTKSIPP